jgi:hypothetical protein
MDILANHGMLKHLKLKITSGGNSKLMLQKTASILQLELKSRILKAKKPYNKPVESMMHVVQFLKLFWKLHKNISVQHI